MKTIEHNKLGHLTVLSSFHRDLKQVALCCTPKHRYFLLWGSGLHSLENLSATEMLTPGGYAPSMSSALKKYMIAAESLETIGFAPIVNGSIFKEDLQ